MKNKFYEIKNIIPNTSADLYLYGEIVTDDTDWWSGEKDETLVGLQSFKKELDNLENISDLNIFMNTPGGEVFVATTICSMLQRLKDSGTKIHTYVDGLCASAGTFILMMGDDINIYENSVIMIHKPINYCYGNAIDFQKCIDVLNTIENSTMIPLYMKKSKVDQEEIKELINEESWLGAERIYEVFNVNLIKEQKQVAACISDLLEKYKNVPQNLKDKLKNKKEPKLDYSDFEKRLFNIRTVSYTHLDVYKRQHKRRSDINASNNNYINNMCNYINHIF